MASDETRLRAALERPARPSSDFDLNPAIALSPVGFFALPGFSTPVWLQGEGARLILTKRSSHLKHHPGQIAFPGGKVDDGDDGAVGAALREAREEVALPTDTVEVLGTLPTHETVTGFSVTPVLAVVRRPLDLRPEAGEVEEVFSVPLAHVLDVSRYRIERRRWRGEWRRYYAVPYGPYYIWGATARILRGLADRVSV